MSRRRVAFALLVVALVAAVALALGVKRTYHAPETPTDFVPAEWQTARTTPMHAAHVGEKKIACTECHASGFVEKPGAASCTRCHAAQAAKAHVGNATLATTCLSCHAFSAQRPAAPCQRCHGPSATPEARRAVPKTIAHHADPKLACTACHDTHGKDRIRADVDCTRCHTGVGATHGALGGPAREPDAGAIAAFAMVAADAGVAPHGGGAGCTACHAPHTDKANARTTCARCHVEGKKDGLASAAPHVDPRGRNVAGHAECVTCHEPHRARRADVRSCEGCHAERRAAIHAKGHVACTSCHTPHAPGEARASCKGCHEGVTALAAARVTAHAACESCHATHEPNASPTAACARCHTTVSPTHPGGAGACVACHAAHPKAAVATAPGHGTAAACSTCHKKAANDHAFHANKAACTDCHKPHAFSLAATREKAQGAAFCGGCHQAPRARTSTRAGHADCRACHGEPHAPVKKPACGSCHQAEVASAPKGHATCTGCHDAHSGDLGAKKACATCHADKTQALHGSTPQGCASCHRPHGPQGVAKPPSCTTCHAKLPGLHAKPSHAASCASCHVAHGPPRSDRATCTTSCHADRRTHQPQAATCKGCHIFRD